jgi:phosphate transport system substrate-binding protein
MHKDKMSQDVQYVAGNPDMFNRVKETQGAIGYVGLGFMTKDLKAVSVDGISPSRATVVSGKFPLARALFMFTNGYPAMGSTLFEFVTFCWTKEGAKLIEDKGFVPMTDY